MTNINTAEVRAALSKATPGPWEAETGTHADGRPWAYLYAGSEPIGSISVNAWDVAVIVNAPAWLAGLCDDKDALTADRDSALAQVAALVGRLRHFCVSPSCPAPGCACPQCRLIANLPARAEVMLAALRVAEDYRTGRQIPPTDAMRDYLAAVERAEGRRF